ncbi:bifunctional hydroxymethylpyrimidine kinase/phosphomethylpyrimidine kinase [Paenimyroides baculatum]|uniref:Hydroxymethylpyrimidine/phosphomethylpyrimidine kinase n=1 Tax=Paenimyroides baculatum TaxID=2608000 RepID=A0A5M6CG30_9FLAO|nr:bifunctional hydroxymethylpyrimidine kinase/phosphomethylpyrimidine kinase [Paenimyroides baculatum]KAA5532079.1 hydroxymethylpyrimidine/phosphomethylpyrimidine kinase [Paenimyroides baculatum]
MQENRPIVLSIAGFDPCGGAGVLADVKTFEQLKTQGMAIITANTIQTEDHFVASEWQDIQTVQKSIEVLMNQYIIQVVKIGVVKDFTFLKSIVDTVKVNNSETFIIWDPVIKSSSGFTFFNEDDVTKLPEVLANIDLLTPNVDEYKLLELVLTESNKVLIKDGHRKEQVGVDILRTGTHKIAILPDTTSVHPKHGSGCVLSAAIAAHLTLGKDLETACRLGKKYVEQYLNSHPYLLGHHHD